MSTTIIRKHMNPFRSIFRLIFSPEFTEIPYLERRRTFVRELKVHEASPQSWDDDPCPNSIRKVEYRSGDFDLKAWVHIPADITSSKADLRPALIYFHCGFAFGMDDFDECLPFIQAGYVVMIPSMRGENGNPGYFEWNYGEVDDGAAAVRWLAQCPFVDSNRIYTFGNSFGGGISGLLSLYENLPIRFSGDVGGFVDESIFRAGRLDFLTPDGEDGFSMPKTEYPFDVYSDRECQMRLLLPNIRWMKRKHYSYVGNSDTNLTDAVVKAKNEIRKMKPDERKLFFVSVPGDCVSSVRPAIEGFLQLAQEDSTK